MDSVERSDSAATGSSSTATVRGIVLYVVLTAGLSSIVWRILITGGTLRAGGGYWTLVLMWCPGVAGIITRLVTQRTLRGVGWGWPAAKYLWAGYWIPIAYGSLLYLPLWAAGYGDFHTMLDQASARLHTTSLPTVLVVLVYVVITGTVGMILNSVAALGEELGWRGFLVPELNKVTSFTKTGLISGLIWACWHMPLIFGADYHGAGPAWYSALCFLVMVTAMGIIAAWIRLRSGSVWPAMLLHASHNLWVQAIFDPMTRHSTLTDYTIGEFGAGLAIIFVAMAVYFNRDYERALRAAALQPGL